MLDKVAVIIVTYNGMQWLPRTLASISDKCDVIVVDNNSTDNTVNYITQNYSNISLFPQKKNLGFGGGNNLGISYAIKQGANYVFLLNQDAYLYPDTIDKLINFHKLNSNYGILSPVHLNGSEVELDWNFSTYLEKEYVKELKTCLNRKKKQENKIYEVPFVNAAAWLLPIRTIDTIGGFDPIFFHYGEDNNYCQRVLYHNLKIGVVANTYVIHDRTTKEISLSSSLNEALKKREKQLKVHWADITKDNLFEVATRKRSLFKKVVSLIAKLNFKEARYKWEEIKLIDKILPEIKKSRERNIITGRHYFNE